MKQLLYKLYSVSQKNQRKKSKEVDRKIQSTKYYKIQNESRARLWQLRKDKIWKMEDLRRVSERCRLEIFAAWKRSKVTLIVAKESTLSSQLCTASVSQSGGHRDRNKTLAFTKERICFVSVGQQSAIRKSNQAITLVLVLVL